MYKNIAFINLKQYINKKRLRIIGEKITTYKKRNWRKIKLY